MILTWGYFPGLSGWAQCHGKSTMCWSVTLVCCKMITPKALANTSIPSHNCHFLFFSQVGNVCLTNKFILLVFTVIADITEIISTIFHCGFWLTHFCMLLASYFYFLWLFWLLFWPLLFYAIHNLHNRFQFFNWLLLQFCCGHKVLNQFPYSFLGTFKEFNYDHVSPGDNFIL